jgi:hypothetical protein
MRSILEKGIADNNDDSLGADKIENFVEEKALETN